MVDMIFLTKSDMSIHIHYNKLASQYHKGKVLGSSASWQLCADTNRPIPQI